MKLIEKAGYRRIPPVEEMPLIKPPQRASRIPYDALWEAGINKGAEEQRQLDHDWLMNREEQVQ